MKPPPIADPVEISNDGEEGETFHLDFWRAFRFYALGLLSFYWFLFFVILAPTFRSPQNLDFRITRLFFTFFPLLGAWVAARSDTWGPITIRNHTLELPNFWGSPLKLGFANIQSVRFSWYGLPYAIISTAEKRNFMRLPLFFRDISAFTRAVEKNTTEENPLRLFLQKRGY
jgi:hypothetical protein